MAGLCRILIAATLVVHLTVGCCSHHAHACDGKDCPLPAHCDATPDGQCPGHGTDHSHHGAKDCQGEKCSFIFPSRIVGDSPVEPFRAHFVALPNDQLPLAVVGREHLTLASCRQLLPVPLHLTNQVLLI